MRISIDMGHNPNGGASKLLNETTENRKIGKRLIEMLKEKGHTVFNCTNDNAKNQLEGIVANEKKNKSDLFVSIHLNAGGGHGTETYTLANASTSTKQKAKAINDAVASSCGFRNRGLKSANYYVLKYTNAPAILVEVCFVDSQEDKNKLNTEKVAKALFKGITGTEYVAPKPSSNSTASTSQFKIGDYGKKVKATSDLNVRTGRGTEHSIMGSLKKGSVTTVNYILPDNRDGKGDDALWGSINFNGKTGFVHLGYVTPIS